MPERIYWFSGFQLNTGDGELRANGNYVRLQEKPLLLLSTLLENPQKVVTREELRRRMWPSDTFVDFDRGINVAIKKVRDALGDSSEHPKFIETIAKKGYRLLVSVELITPESTATAHPKALALGPDLGVPNVAHGNSQTTAQEIRVAPDSENGRHPLPMPEPLAGRTKFWVGVFAVPAALVVAVTMISAFAFLRPRVTTQTLRLNLTLPAHLKLLSITDNGAGLALSSDGTRIVFPAIRSDGKTELWMRRMEQLDPEPLPGTEGASSHSGRPTVKASDSSPRPN